ncbi:MAG: SGNH/GDSL hydrolase family protein [Bacteroidota bacterium]
MNDPIDWLLKELASDISTKSEEELANIELELKKHVKIKENPGAPFSPELESTLKISPEEATDRGFVFDTFMDLANKWGRKRRLRSYEIKKEKYPERTKIVAEGDSWFQYPLLLKDIIDQLSGSYNILCLSAAGAELQHMFKEDEFFEAIEKERPSFFLLSGGGNDLLGDSFKLFLDDYTPGIPGQEPERFLKDNFEGFLETIGVYYQSIFKRAKKYHDDFGLQVLVHGYDFIIPYEKSKRGGWVGKYMEKKKIEDQLDKQALINYILKRFHTVLSSLVDSFSYVHFVHTQGTLPVDRNYWADEIHPTDEGFRLVAQKFSKKIQALSTPPIP